MESDAKLSTDETELCMALGKRIARLSQTLLR